MADLIHYYLNYRFDFIKKKTGKVAVAQLLQNK